MTLTPPQKSSNKDLYIHIHIPRTGGTSLINHMGNWLSRENNDYLKLYNLTSFSTDRQSHKLPTLYNLTKDQEAELLFVTGHLLNSLFIDTLKNKRTAKYFTFIRHPIHRLLSSFNYKVHVQTLTQNKSHFSGSWPPLSNRCIINNVGPCEFNTLYEYYLESDYEQNFQSKYIINFFKHLDFKNSNIYDRQFTWDRSGGIVNPMLDCSLEVFPSWMKMNAQINAAGLDIFKIAADLLTERMWFTQPFERYNKQKESLARYISGNYIENVDINSADKYWTIEDVKKQPDYELLLKAEHHDMKLYQWSLNLPEPVFK